MKKKPSANWLNFAANLLYVKFAVNLRIVFKMSYKKQKKKEKITQKDQHVDENDLIFLAHKTAYLLLV